MVALYVRVSTREQLSGYGIDSQLALLIDYCDKKGIDKNDIKIYKDAGFSGASFKRPGLKELIKDIKAGEIDSLICQKLDRLSRGLDIQAKIFNILNKNDVTLMCSHEDIQTKTANGRLIINIQGSVAEWERDTIIERTLDGMRQSAREGNYAVSGSPFGYDKVNNKLVINEKEAEIVRLIFNKISNHVNISELIIILNSRYGHVKKWRYDHIYSILKKKIYFGLFDYYDLHIENHSPAIITKKIWIAAQERKGRNKINYESRGYLFKALVKCHLCDVMVVNTSGTSQNGTVYIYYKCPRCKRSTNEDSLVKAFNIAHMTALAKGSDDIDKRLKELFNKKEEIIRLYIDNIINLHDYHTSLKALNERYEATKVLSKSNVKKGRSCLTNSRDLNKIIIKEVLDSIEIDFVMKYYYFKFKNDIELIVDQKEDSFFVKV